VRCRHDLLDCDAIGSSRLNGSGSGGSSSGSSRHSQQTILTRGSSGAWSWACRGLPCLFRCQSPLDLSTLAFNKGLTRRAHAMGIGRSSLASTERRCRSKQHKPQAITADGCRLCVECYNRVKHTCANCSRRVVRPYITLRSEDIVVTPAMHTQSQQPPAYLRILDPRIKQISIAQRYRSYCKHCVVVHECLTATTGIGRLRAMHSF